MLRRLYFVLCGLIVAGWAPAVNALSLSADQHLRLERGEIVVLDVLPGGGGGRGQGGTAVAVVRATPDAVWRLLVDYPHHTGLYPRVVTTEVLQRDARHALVRYEIGVGPFSFRFHVDNYPDVPRHRLVWRLAHDRPNGLFRDTWGYWQVESHAEDTVLTYAMAARTVLPAFLTRGSERAGLVDALTAVRARAESGR
jgi:ribosome-associated toxin RatA of RatAB toxin-antitoxin module